MKNLLRFVLVASFFYTELFSMQSQPVVVNNITGYTALHIAIVNGDWQKIEHLISAENEINCPDASLQTPLHLACDRLDFNCISKLIEYPNIELGAVDCNGKISLDLIIERINSQNSLLSAAKCVYIIVQAYIIRGITIPQYLQPKIKSLLEISQKGEK